MYANGGNMKSCWNTKHETVEPLRTLKREQIFNNRTKPACFILRVVRSALIIKTMEYKGKVYAKINGKYIECTETVQQLEDKISKLESALDKIATGTQPYNEREAFIFVDIAKHIASEALS
jgi:hypothetical protein